MIQDISLDSQRRMLKGPCEIYMHTHPHQYKLTYWYITNQSDYYYYHHHAHDKEVLR